MPAPQPRCRLTCPAQRCPGAGAGQRPLLTSGIAAVSRRGHRGPALCYTPRPCPCRARTPHARPAPPLRSRIPNQPTLTVPKRSGGRDFADSGVTPRPERGAAAPRAGPRRCRFGDTGRGRDPNRDRGRPGAAAASTARPARRVSTNQRRSCWRPIGAPRLGRRCHGNGATPCRARGLRREWVRRRYWN